MPGIYGLSIQFISYSAFYKGKNKAQFQFKVNTVIVRLNIQKKNVGIKKKPLGS